MTRRTSSDRNSGNGAEVWALHGNSGSNGVASIGESLRGRPLLDGSPQMRAIGTVIANIADTDPTVLIRGESSVGKEVVARAIQAASSRRSGPFVKVNCAAIPHALLESELFGHE